MKIWKKGVAVFFAAAMICGLNGCGSRGGDKVEVLQWKKVDASLGLPDTGFQKANDEMLQRAMVSVGDTTRLQAAMNRAAKGEKVTIATIGGSITQGTAAATTSDCYASQTFEWWSKAFPSGDFNFVNAGIGATGSYIGVHRLERDVLSYQPDVVVVEFSVNDTDATFNKETYDSLVRKILNAENQPAVILLFTTQEDGTSLQDTHMEIGTAYQLPMISYKNAVLQEIENGSFTWKDISPDNIHPNTEGHHIIADLMWNYFNFVYENLDASVTQGKAFSTDAVSGDKYAQAKLYDSENLTPVEMTGFEESSVFSQFPNDFTADTENASITFEVEGKNIGLLYHKTVDGKSGKYCVYVDDHLSGIIDADFSGGWGNYAEAEEVYTSEESGKHIVRIESLGDDSGKNKFSILGLLVS